MPSRPLTTEDRQAVKDLLTDAVRRLFLPDAGNTLAGQPIRDYLAGPTPSNPFGAINHAMGRAACDAWARGDGSGIPPRRELLMRDTCTPYIESIGVAPAGAFFGPPFTNGQCAGLTYHLRVGGTFVDYLDGSEIGQGSLPVGTRTTVVLTGPITGVTREPATFGTTGLPSSWNLRVAHNNGATRLFDVDPTNRPSLGGRSERRIQSLSVTFVRTNGSAITCGDRPDEFDAGNPGSGVPGPGPIPSPPGFDLPFPGIDVTLNPDGTIGIDFGDGEPPSTVDPGGPSAGPSGPPPGGGDPGAGGTATPGTDAEDEAPPGKMLWGLRITVSDAPPDARQYAPGVYRAVCYVYMGDDDGLDHDPAGAMLRSGQFVLAERDYLTKWRVTANPGYTLDVVPYYKDIEETP